MIETNLVTADDFAALAPQFEEQEAIMQESFDTPEIFVLTEEQMSLVAEFAPTWIVGGIFQGDDNDLACIISRVAREWAKVGEVDKAVFIEMELAPKGFNTATKEEFIKFFDEIAADHDSPKDE